MSKSWSQVLRGNKANNEGRSKSHLLWACRADVITTPILLLVCNSLELEAFSTVYSALEIIPGSWDLSFILLKSGLTNIMPGPGRTKTKKLERQGPRCLAWQKGLWNLFFSPKFCVKSVLQVPGAIFSTTKKRGDFRHYLKSHFFSYASSSTLYPCQWVSKS